MSLFSETVRQDTPRLVVMFQRGPDGGERFQWGIVGEIPILTLIGAVVQVQADVDFLKEACPCDVLACVVAWNAASRAVSCFIHPDMPTVSLVGMLETIKAALVGSRVAAHQAAQRILGPDGKAFNLRGQHGG